MDNVDSDSLSRKLRWYCHSSDTSPLLVVNIVVVTSNIIALYWSILLCELCVTYYIVTMHPFPIHKVFFVQILTEMNW